MKWVTMWGNAQSKVLPHPAYYAKDLTLRYPVFVPFDGNMIRITLDNYCCNEEVKIDKVGLCIGNQKGELFDENKLLTFNGKYEAIIKAHGTIVSDPLDIVLKSDEFKFLFESVGWSSPSLSQIDVSLNNSLVVFSLYKDDKLVGMARLLGDKGMSYFIKDFVIHPNYQGQGLGRRLMDHINQYILNQIEENWAVCVELVSAKGKEEFYKKLGFTSLPNDFSDSGMRKMIRK